MRHLVILCKSDHVSIKFLPILTIPTYDYCPKSGNYYRPAPIGPIIDHLILLYIVHVTK